MWTRLLDERRLAGEGPGLRLALLSRRLRRSEFDHYDVEYTFADGAKLLSQQPTYARLPLGVRQLRAWYEGSAVISTFMHTPAKCRIYKGQDFAKENLVWAFRSRSRTPTSSNGIT